MYLRACFAAVHLAILLLRPTPENFCSPNISTVTRTRLPGTSSGFLQNKRERTNKEQIKRVKTNS